MLDLEMVVTKWARELGVLMGSSPKSLAQCSVAPKKAQQIGRVLLLSKYYCFSGRVLRKRHHFATMYILPL